MINLVQALTMVALLKTLTIPRLELCGAQLLAKMMDATKTTLQGRIRESYLWTDSGIVLKWLSKSPNELKTFVANRIAHIQELTTNDKWNWIMGTENPADIASRGATPANLRETPLWWKGPSWLSQPQDTWPSEEAPEPQRPSEVEDEMKPVILHLTAAEELIKGPWFKDKSMGKASIDFPLLETYSDLNKLITTILHIKRAIYNFKQLVNKGGRVTGYISSNERETALLQLIPMDQQKHFSQEINQLKKNKDRG